MNAFIVAVNYTDELRLTLPWNRHHFKKVVVITDYDCCPDIIRLVDKMPDTWIEMSDKFTTNGASFNKWLPLDVAVRKAGLDTMHDFVCVMDADVLWPKDAKFPLVPGQLYTPYRRMYPNVPKEVPPESEWGNYPRHKVVEEFSGYTQVFHSDDPALDRCAMCGKHRNEHLRSEGCLFHLWQTDWVHAGGADSFFQNRWAPENKVRPGWDCLHLGEVGHNWYGRSSPLADGTVLPGSEERRRAYLDIWPKRRRERDPQFKSERTARAD